MPDEQEDERQAPAPFQPTSELVAGLDLSNLPAEYPRGRQEAGGPIEPTHTVVHATANLVSGPNPQITLDLIFAELQRHHRIVLCPPDLIDQIQAHIDNQRLGGLFEVRANGEVPPGRIYVMYPGALDTPEPRSGYDTTVGPSPLREEEER